MNDLDLSALSTGPVPALASPSDVKARGEQRRHRSRVALAGAAALVVLAGAGTAAALAHGGKPDALVPAAPTPTPSGSWAPVQAKLSALVLQPEDGADILGGSWQLSPYPKDNNFALLQACKEADVHGERGLVQGLDWRGGATAHGLTSQVLEYVSVEAAQRAHEAVLADVARCPQRPEDSEDGKAFATSSTFPLAHGAIGVRQVSRDCDTCPAHPRDWAVVTAGRWVGYVSFDRPYLQAWADALKTRLEHPVLEPVTPTPSPTDEFTLSGPLGPQDMVEANRFGPVAVGMTLAEAEEAAGEELKQQGDQLGSCVYYAPRSGSPDVSFMVINGVVSRIDVDSGRVTTNNNRIGIGSTEAEVKDAYRNTVVSKHPYTDGHYLRTLDVDPRYAILFETDGHKVTSFRAGYTDAVDQPEGCA